MSFSLEDPKLEINAKNLSSFCAEWRDVARNTQPLNKPQCEEKIKALYAEINEEPPNFLWCASPASSIVAIYLLADLPLAHTLDKKITQDARAFVETFIAAGRFLKCKKQGGLSLLGPPAARSINNWTTHSLKHFFEKQHEKLLSTTIEPLLARHVGKMSATIAQVIQKSLESCIWERTAFWEKRGWLSLNHCSGQLDASRIALGVFCREFLPVRYPPRWLKALRILEEITRSCFFFWPFRNVCVISERPIRLILNNRGFLHSSREPALSFSDGWGIWALDGSLVSREIVDFPWTLSPTWILSEPNVELRRIMIERYGTAKFLEDASAEIIDQDSDSHGPRVLYSLHLPGDENLVMIKVQCNRKDGKVDTYYLRVPPSISTCREAVAWTFGKEIHEYGPIVES